MGEPGGASLEERLARMRAAAEKSRSITPMKRPTQSGADPRNDGRTVSSPNGRPSSSRPDSLSRAGQGAVHRRFDVSSWGGALLVMAVLAAVLYVVEAFDVASGHRLDRFGIQPREISGLDGVVFAPFLHAGWWHLISNTVPFVLLGWVILVSGLRTWLFVTAVVVALGGLATWLVAPPGVIVGASGVVFGWLGYLIARAFLARRVVWIAVAVLVVCFFGSLFAGLLPTVSAAVSWQAHVCGFVAGVAAAWWLHARSARSGRTPDAASVS